MTTPARVDLDGASSLPLHPAARQTFRAALDAGWADPRRLHGGARQARLLLDNARAVVAECLDVRPDEVTFTHTGTDAVHRGLLGLVRGARGAQDVVHTAVEHSSVLHAVTWGAQARPVPVDGTGRVDVEALNAEVARVGVAAVAVQHANHEVGTIQPVDALDVPDGVGVFVDACASMGRLDLPRRADVVAGSAHKWGGPAGVGVLVVRKGARWRNPFPEDDRIDERSSGFENVPAALAAAAALQAVVAERDRVGTEQHALIDLVRHRVAAVGDVEVVGHPTERLPHLVTFSCLYVDGEALVTELDRRGFSVASGSACTASTLRPSHVLEAMGVLTHGNVRLSLHRDTTREQVEAFCDALGPVVTELRARVGL
ncbi:MAG: cysteine desulfurase family protein [Nocardioides sp.]|uniref:cysteine desulfurase family protein n=1 Tax=Nocardioides sp. TaxID=35761 RepID=UPI003F09F89E